MNKGLVLALLVLVINIVFVSAMDMNVTIDGREIDGEAENSTLILNGNPDYVHEIISDEGTFEEDDEIGEGGFVPTGGIKRFGFNLTYTDVDLVGYYQDKYDGSEEAGRVAIANGQQPFFYAKIKDIEDVEYLTFIDGYAHFYENKDENIQLEGDLPEGNYIFNVSAEMMNGTVMNFGMETTIYHDTSVPDSDIDGPSDGSVVKDVAELEYSVSDESGMYECKYALNGGAEVGIPCGDGGELTATLNAVEGQNTLVVTFTNSLRNSITETISFIFDGDDTLTVGEGKEFSSINEAIENAQDGDTIKVYDGTYEECVVLDKSLSLIGESVEGTIIDGSGCELTISGIGGGEMIPSALEPEVELPLGGSQYTLKNIKIINDEFVYSPLIYFDGASTLLIRNVDVSEANAYYGIYLDGDFGSSATIKESTLNNKCIGAYVDSVMSLIVTDNIIDSNGLNEMCEGDTGLHVELVSYLTVEGNTISNNDGGIYINTMIGEASIEPSRWELVASSMINHNKFSGNIDYNIYAEDEVNASENWWNTLIYSEILDTVNENVDFVPWCINEDCTLYSDGLEIFADNLDYLLSSGMFSPSGDAEESDNISVTTDFTLKTNTSEGFSKVKFADGTVIIRSDNESINASDLSSTTPSASSVSNLGNSYVNKGILQWGLPEIELTFDPAIELEIYVGTSLNGVTLEIRRSTTGDGWTDEGLSASTCVVEDGYCKFTATKASYYSTFVYNPPAPTTTTTTSSSSGGGSGGCISKWECGEWTECVDGKQTRECKSTNSCSSLYNRPATTQECTVEKKVEPVIKETKTETETTTEANTETKTATTAKTEEKESSSDKITGAAVVVEKSDKDTKVGIVLGAIILVAIGAFFVMKKFTK